MVFIEEIVESETPSGKAVKKSTVKKSAKKNTPITTTTKKSEKKSSLKGTGKKKSEKYVSMAEVATTPSVKTPVVNSKTDKKGKNTTPHPSKAKNNNKEKAKKSVGVSKIISFNDDSDDHSDEAQISGAAAVVSAALKDGKQYPTPPFSCKPVLSKGVLKVLVTLHKTPPQFVRFEVTPTHFYLDTLKDTKKYRIVHQFPSSIKVQSEPEPEAVFENRMLKLDLTVVDWGELTQTQQEVVNSIKEKKAEQKSKRQGEKKEEDVKEDGNKTKEGKKNKKQSKKKKRKLEQSEDSEDPRKKQKKQSKKVFLEKSQVNAMIEELGKANANRTKNINDREMAKEKKEKKLEKKRDERLKHKERGQQHIASEATKFIKDKNKAKKEAKRAKLASSKEGKRRVSFGAPSFSP